MVALTAPITAETFEENWKIVDNERRKAKKKYIMTGIASFFSNMAFAFLILIVSNGLIHNHLEGSYCDFLEDIPYLLPIWDKICALILKPEWGIGLQIAVPLILVYAVCFAVCGIFVLIVMGIYHPFRRKLPTSTVKENANQMLTMARDARRYSRRSGASGSMLWALIFMMIQYCIIALYIIIELEDLNAIFTVVTAPIMELLNPVTKDFTTMQLMSLEAAVFAPALMVFTVMLYLAYALLNQIHATSVQFMYKYHVPYSFVADVEYYYTFADENTEGMTEEEISTRRKEESEAKRIQGLDLERIGAYGKAKELLAEAAHGGDVAAMEHYGRHWLVIGAVDPGKYWLQKCVDTGMAGEYAIKTLRRIKWHLPVRAKFLK